MPSLFAQLGAGLEGSAVVALAAALAWGVLSVLLSPCHLATIPLVVGFVGGLGPETKRARAMAVAWSFAAGMFAALALVGVVVVSLGRALERVRAYGSWAIAIVLLAAGLHLLGLIPMPTFAGGRPRASSRKGVFGALGAGLFLGVGLSPCTFAFLAPVLGAAFGAAAANAVRGFALLGAFALGHCLVVGAAGSSAAFARRFVAWDGSRGSRVFKGSCGALLVVGAAVLIYGA